MEEEGKGFKVTDRRRIGKEEEEAKEKVEENTQEKVEQEISSQSPEGSVEATSLPPINFTTFILSLSTSALLHFGEIPDPVSNETRKDLAMAKHTIDMISMLKEKTAGNLGEEEDNLITSVLSDLKMKYVKETG